jgi:hypothetical protein
MEDIINYSVELTLILKTTLFIEKIYVLGSVSAPF